MKRLLVFALAVAAVGAVPCSAMSKKHMPAALQSRAANGTSLESVLDKMDEAAAAFKTAQASLQQDQFTKVVNETDTEKGTIYFQRTPKGLDMMVEFAQPQQKYVLYSGNALMVYQPSIEQVNKYDLSKHKSEVETFLTLGFGGRGHDLQKSFEVKVDGTDTIDGRQTAKLELVPKNPQVKANANRILLWIDLANGIAVQQQFFQPSGDFRLAKYGNIKLNQNLPADTFKLKTNSRTKTISQ